MTTELIDTSSDAGTPGSSIASKLVPPHVARSTLSIQLVPPGKDNDPDESVHTCNIHYDYNNPNIILQQRSRRGRPVHASYTINVAELDIVLDESKVGAAVLIVLVRSDTVRQLKYPIGYPETQAYCMIQGDKLRCTLPGSLPADTKLKILMVNGHRMTGSLREDRRVVSYLLEIKENYCMHMNTEDAPESGKRCGTSSPVSRRGYGSGDDAVEFLTTNSSHSLLKKTLLGTASCQPLILPKLLRHSAPLSDTIGMFSCALNALFMARTISVEATRLKPLVRRDPLSLRNQTVSICVRGHLKTCLFVSRILSPF